MYINVKQILLSAQYVKQLLFTNCMKYIHLEHDVHDNNTRKLQIKGIQLPEKY